MRKSSLAINLSTIRCYLLQKCRSGVDAASPWDQTKARKVASWGWLQANSQKGIPLKYTRTCLESPGYRKYANIQLLSWALSVLKCRWIVRGMRCQSNCWNVLETWRKTKHFENFRISASLSLYFEESFCIRNECRYIVQLTVIFWNFDE